MARGKPTSITATSLGRWCASPEPARYRFREQLFPTMHFRLTYDALRQWRGERADVEYVRILHLAATTMEATVDSALSLLLEAGESFDYAEVRDLESWPETPILPKPLFSWRRLPM